MATVKQLMNEWAIAHRQQQGKEVAANWTATFQDSSYDLGGCETCGPEMVYTVDISYYDADGGFKGYEEYQGSLGELIEEMSRGT